MQKKFLQYINNQKLLNNTEHVICAVSGGKDSMCMLDLFIKTQKATKINIIIAHVNYNLRGAESQKDEQLVRDQAKKHNLNVHIEKCTPQNTSEEHLREIRYSFFKKLQKKYNKSKIATAHSANDHAETILMFFLRGAGLNGLQGIQHQKDIIRPLIWATTNDIKKHNQQHNILFREDKTNKNNTYTRNIIRNKVIPLIESEINPNIINTLSSNAKTISKQAKIINNHIEKELRKITITKTKNQITLNTKEIEDTKILPSLIHHCISKIKTGNHNLTSKHIDEISKFAVSPLNKTKKRTINGLHIKKNHDTISLHFKPTNNDNN